MSRPRWTRPRRPGAGLRSLAVARAVIRVYALLKTNREMIGNSLPHLHTHLVLRFTGDPLPRQLFPLTAQQPDQHIP